MTCTGDIDDRLGRPCISVHIIIKRVVINSVIRFEICKAHIRVSNVVITRNEVACNVGEAFSGEALGDTVDDRSESLVVRIVGDCGVTAGNLN